LIDELLQGLVVTAHTLGQRLDGLALTLPQQSLQILPAPMPPFAPAQLRRELLHVFLQLLSHLHDLPGCHHGHASSPPRLSHQYT
jgi:hypothetical protein